MKATTASPCRGRGDERIRWGVDHGTYEEDDPVTCIGISNAIYNTVGNASSGRRRCRLTPCCAGAAAPAQLCRPHAAGRWPWLIVPAGTPGSRERAADHRMPGEEACAAPGGRRQAAGRRRRARPGRVAGDGQPALQGLIQRDESCNALATLEARRRGGGCDGCTRWDSEHERETGAHACGRARRCHGKGCGPRAPAGRAGETRTQDGHASQPTRRGRGDVRRSRRRRRGPSPWQRSETSR